MKKMTYCIYLILTLWVVSLAAQEKETKPDKKRDASSALRDKSLEELMEIRVRSTSFFETSLAESPGYTQVIDMADNERSPARTLQDILHMFVPGTYTGVHGRAGVLHGVRGILTDANTKTIVSLDGQHLNQRMGFGYMTGMMSPLIGDIDQIEVTLGPGSLTQGSGAINGVINMIPKNGVDNPGSFFNIEHGFKEKAYVVEAGHGLSYGQGKNLYLYAGAYDAHGFEPDNTFGQETTFPIDAYGFGDTGLRFSSHWQHQDFNLNTFYFENNPVTGTAETGIIVNDGFWHTATAGLRPKFDLKLAPEHTLSFNGSLIWIDFYKETPQTSGATLGGGSERHSDITVVYKSTAKKNNSFALGMLYGYKKFREKDQYLGGDLSLAFASANTSWSEVSVFTEDRWTIIDPLSLTLGLRYDNISLNENLATPVGEPAGMLVAFDPADIDDHYSPQIALTYKITPGTIAKLSFRHGFRIPDAVHYKLTLLSNKAAESLGLSAHNLEPETIDSYEFNLHSQSAKALSVDLNLFHNEFSKQLSFGPLENVWGTDATAVIAAGGSAIGMIQNLTNVEQSYGGELVVNWEFMPNTLLQGSYSYTEVGDRLPQRTPVHIVKLDLGGSLMTGKLHYSLSYLFSSAMDNVGNPSSDQWHDAYKQQEHFVNISLDYGVSEWGNIYLRVHNLLEDDRPVTTFASDKPYRGYLGSDERRIYLGFRTGF